MKARLPQGVGGGPQNMNAMIRQAQKMQEDMAALQEELDAKTYEITAGGGAVTIKISGKKEILSLDISPEIVDPEDIEMLEDLVMLAFNNAQQTCRTESEAAMNKAVPLPAGMKLPF